MKRTFVGLALVFLAALATSCADSEDQYEKSVREQLKLLKEFNDVLAAVADKPSLETATPWIADLGRQIAQNAEARTKIGEPPEARRNEIEAKYDYRDELDRQNRLLDIHLKRVAAAETISRKSFDRMRESIKNIGTKN